MDSQRRVKRNVVPRLINACATRSSSFSSCDAIADSGVCSVLIWRMLVLRLLTSCLIAGVPPCFTRNNLYLLKSLRYLIPVRFPTSVKTVSALIRNRACHQVISVEKKFKKLHTRTAAAAIIPGVIVVSSSLAARGRGPERRAWPDRPIDVGPRKIARRIF